MDGLTKFRTAVLEWAAGGPGAPGAEASARAIAADLPVRLVVLVEGVSDQVAVETLAGRRGVDLAARGIAVLPLGGATSVGRFLDIVGPPGLGIDLAGLCDVGEERHFIRGLERVGLGKGLTRADLQQLGFFVCDTDLEDELIRCLGVDAVQRVIEEQGDLRSLRTLQRQPAQRGWTVDQHLRRFMGSIGGRKARYARALMTALGDNPAPRPLELLVEHLGSGDRPRGVGR
ncbi:TOPRIM nucleotidyl transferase/hydrolase domain-containing protein [Homoserinimonas sp. A447]